MEVVQATLQAKTLEQLERLEQKASRDVQQILDQERQLREVEELKSKIQELTKRKRALLQQLRHLPTDSLGARILKDVAVDDVPASSLAPEVQREIVLKASKQEKKRQLEYVLVAHRCAGLTASIVEKGRVRVRFETSYKGRYFEPFYLELQFNGKKIKSCWHTVPVFVPLDSQVEKYNNSEIHFSTLLCDVHSYLTAYVKRRQQVIEFSERYRDYLSADTEIASSCDYSFIHLAFNIPVVGASLSQLFVQLHYKDLQSELPSRVRCSKPVGLPVERSQIKQSFMALPLAEAFESLFLDQTIGQG